MGRRFLQLPIGEVEHVTLAQLEALQHDARTTGAGPTQLRPLTIELDYLENPHGSALITQGKTKVLCTAMVQEEVPRWLRNQGRGWMTAEYSLLPASTGDRVEREASRGKQQGRTIEIQRLIGRAMRARRRLPGARRAHALARLRRAAGRRRHALRRDLRRVRRGEARARPLRPLARVRRLGRRGLGRRRRRRAAARPRLLRGLERRHRHERRHDRRRPADRGAGDGGAAIRSRARRSTSCSRSPRPGSREIGEIQAEAVAVALP